MSKWRKWIIMEMTWWFIFESKMPNFFWAEAVYTLMYIQFQIYSKTVRDKTPFELWHRHKLFLKHLKVFGSVYYLHLPKERRDKVREKGLRWVSCLDAVRSLKVLECNIETQKVLISRDVKINEEERWD